MTYSTLQIRISAGTKFQNKLTILIMWTKFSREGYLWSKSEKVNITTGFCIFELVYDYVHNILRHFDRWANFFFTKREEDENTFYCQKKVFPMENGKSEHHHWILYIWISLSTKFQLKLKFLIFGPKILLNVLSFISTKIKESEPPLNPVVDQWIPVAIRILSLTVLNAVLPPE